MAHFKLTEETKLNNFGVKLFRIEATVAIPSKGIKKGDGGGFIENECNLRGDAWVSGDARVYGNAWVCAKKAFTKGWFIGGDDSGKITDITAQTGSTYWKNQYVLGDYEINDIEPQSKDQTINIEGKEYSIAEIKSKLSVE